MDGYLWGDLAGSSIGENGHVGRHFMVRVPFVRRLYNRTMSTVGQRVFILSPTLPSQILQFYIPYHQHYLAWEHRKSSLFL